jgi:hypothetical protein
MNCSSNIVVFDLDETLGYFMELGMFWDALKSYIIHTNTKKITIDQTLFNKILDLYPEFLRPNIIGILNYLKKKKERNHCHKLMIYTNNQGPVEWAKYIMNYFETKINYKIFDQIIAAFKVQGKQIELCRTTHMKTHSDLIKCTKIPENTHICFLDDVFYPDMSNENIYYINVKPYVHDLDFNEMITRFLNSGVVDDPTSCREHILAFMKRYNYIYVGKTGPAQEVDKVVSKKILQHLHIFFKTNVVSENAKNSNSNTNTNKSSTKRNKNVFNKSRTLKTRKK